MLEKLVMNRSGFLLGRLFISLSAAFSLPSSAAADVKLPKILSDHMVLQQSIGAAIWGTADPGENVTVSFRGQRVSSSASKDGRWQIRLGSLEPGGADDLVVTAKNILTLRDVLVGEVWLCSGQSNMQWPVAKASNAEQEIAQSQFPKIRLFTVTHELASMPQEDVGGEWVVTSPETVRDFSAVGYFFGRDLYHHLNVPVGLIESTWGGTPAESWTSEKTLSTDLALVPILEKWKRIIAEYSWGSKASYDRRLKEWENLASTAEPQGKAPPRKPAVPPGPGHPWTPAGLYNGMIAPLTFYAIRGVIWYQGERNANSNRGYEYRRLFQALIADWRNAWNQGPFPFLFAQLANFSKRAADPGESGWAEVREAQTMALALPNTGMASAIDNSVDGEGHPTNKQEVARRLALAARAVAYGEELVYSGPIYKGSAVEGRQIRVRFCHVGQGGLKARGGGNLEGFVIAGRDRRFVWADARIDQDTVVVSSADVADPVAVRYAWADNPACNLVNRQGLPASPFRTDDWPGLSSKLE